MREWALDLDGLEEGCQAFSFSDAEDDSNPEDDESDHPDIMDDSDTSDSGRNVENVDTSDSDSTADDTSDSDSIPYDVEDVEGSQGAHNSHLDVVNDLNEEETEKLLDLQDVIGINDFGICRALLESKNWDLDATIQEQMSAPIQNDIGGSSERVQVHPPRRSWTSWIMNWSLYLLTTTFMLPLKLTQDTFIAVFDFFSRIFTSLTREKSQTRGSMQSGDNPRQDVKRFKETFEAQYGRDHPEFYLGSYSQVLEEGKRHLKFVIIYLHSPSHEDTEHFCKDVLVSLGFCEFVRSNRVLFWGCSVESKEGYLASQALRECTYPFLAVTVLRHNKMTMVGRIEGYAGTEEILRRLQSIFWNNEAFLVASRAEREERRRNQSIRLEQDAAFEETLRQDQEKERKKQEELNKKLKEEEEQLRLRQEEIERKEKIRRMKISMVSQVAEEPHSSHPEMIRILIKLPEGQRLERRFLRSQSLKDLYLFVFCHPDSPDDFNIEMNFPKRILRCKPGDNPVSFEEAGFGQSTTLFVHDLDA